MADKLLTKHVVSLLICGVFFISCSDDFEKYEFPTKNGTIRISQLDVGDITNVIFTYRNFLIEDREISGKRYLCISDDLGKTWKQFENTYGNLVYFHIYSTGDMMFATSSWCYYIDSGLTKITPSHVYDNDGKEFKAVANKHFYQEGDAKNYIWKLEDVEINVWGDYSLAGSADPNYIARVWYSTDYGKTIKCAIRFDKTQIDGKVQNCRHTHGVRFDGFEETFYITTGDNDSQCQLIKGKYETNSDQWIFQRLGSGMNYKLLGMYFDRDNAYLVTDYNYYDDNFQPGLIKCNKNYLYDITHFEYLYRNADFQALLLFESDMNGNKVITPDGKGVDIYYARNNYNFVKIPTSVGKCITGFTSPNYNGDVYARVGSGRLSNFFNFTRAMRNSGVFDYMRFEEQNSSFFDDDFFFTDQK